MSDLASCTCGQLTAQCEGPPVRTTVCHCLECKRHSGSAFSWNARYDAAQVTVSGPSTAFTRVGDEGSHITQHFCPTCGVTVYYTVDEVPGMIAVQAGAFADVDFMAPSVSVYDPSRHVPWLVLTNPDMKTLD
jgi:hypothetical protein